MLAVVKDPAKRGVLLEEVPVPAVGPWEALVRVRAVGICGSDQRIYAEVSSVRRRRFVIGHEIAGEVVEVGERATADEHDLVRVPYHVLARDVPDEEAAIRQADLEIPAERLGALPLRYPGTTQVLDEANGKLHQRDS